MFPSFLSLLCLVLVASQSPDPVTGYDHQLDVFPSLPNFYQIYWTVDSSNPPTYIDICVQCQSPGWFGIGFNPSQAQMIGSDAVIAHSQADNGGSVGSWTLSSEDIPDAPTQWPVADEQLTEVSLTRQDGFGQLMKFRRPLAPAGLTAISPGQDAFVVCAFGWLPDITYHEGNKTTLTVNFATGGAASASPPFIKLAHASLMSLAWLVLIPLGIIIAKFFRTQDNDEWFQSHRLFQSSGYVLTLIAFTLAVVMVGSQQFTCPHADAGLATVIAATLQMCLGIFRPKPQAPRRPIWNLAHHWLGRLTLLNAWATVILGFLQIGANAGFVIAAAVWMALVLLFYCHMLTRLTRYERGGVNVNED